MLYLKVKNYLFIVVAVFALGGCATVYNPATEKKELILIDDATEASLGKNVAKELTQKEKLSSDQKAQERAAKIGKKISAVSDRQSIQYEFAVLENKELNAVSLPGGFIYINSGLLDKLNDDELAFVLGHEVGHVAAKHAVKKIQSSMAFGLIMAVGAASLNNSQAASGSAQILDATDKIYSLISLGYSRQDEYFADKLGLKYTYKAGFNPYGALTALELLKDSEAKEPKSLVYLRTHPYVDDRISQLKILIPQIAGDKKLSAN